MDAKEVEQGVPSWIQLADPVEYWVPQTSRTLEVLLNVAVGMATVDIRRLRQIYIKC